MGTNQKQSTENFIKDVRRKTRRLFSFEQKILIVMEAVYQQVQIIYCMFHTFTPTPVMAKYLYQLRKLKI